jgi:hypothetical protein
MQDGPAAHPSRSGKALRPLAVSALARQLIGGSVAQVLAVHASGISLVVPGRPDVCYAGGTGRGLLPLHAVLREGDLGGLLETLDAGESLPLDLSGVRVFRLRLEAGCVAPLPPAVGLVAAWLRAQPGTCGLGMPAAEALEPSALERRTLACVAAGAAESEQALRTLIGRGAGSTPAGDDVLVGALAHALATTGAAAPLVQSLQRLAPEFDRLTTAAGATYLRAALAGEFGSDLLAFVRALHRPPPAQALRRAMRVAAHGATSGIDSLVGFVAAQEEGHNPGLQPSGE